MRIYLIGIVYKSNDSDEIDGFRLLDVDSGDVLDVPYKNVYKVLKDNKASVSGIELRNGKLDGSNGSFDRYPKIVNKKLVGNNAIIILDQIGDIGYKVSDWKGTIKKFKEDDIIKVVEEGKMGIANGKLVVKNDGSKFISSISGSYPRVDIKQGKSNKVDNKLDNKVDNKLDNKVDNKLDNKVDKGVDKTVDNKVSNVGNIGGVKIGDYSPYNGRYVTGEDTNKSKTVMCKDGMTVEQKLTKAMLTVRNIAPFYYSIFVNIKKKESEAIPTMGVTDDTLYFNVDFVKDLETAEVVFILLHEILHLAMEHPLREKNRIHYIWNVACDLYINKVLVEDFKLNMDGSVRHFDGRNGEPYDSTHVGIKNPEGLLFNEKVSVENDTPEKIYEEIIKNNNFNSPSMSGGGQNDGNGNGNSNMQGSSDSDKGNKNSSGGGAENNQSNGKDSIGNGSSSGSGGSIDIKDIVFRGKKYGKALIGSLDDLFKDPNNRNKSDTTRSDKAKSILRQAKIFHKQFGHGGHVDSFFERYVDKVLAPKVNWRRLLRNKLVNKMSKEYSFASPNRKFIYRGEIRPGPIESNPDTIENVKVCIDTSGSITDRELGVALNQIHDLLKTYKTTAEVLYWDTAVRKVEKLDNADRVLKSKPQGGGGTDPNCVFEYFEGRDYKIGLKPKPSVIVMFTDGVFGEIERKYYKYRDTIWIIYNNDSFKAPFGVAAKFNIE